MQKFTIHLVLKPVINTTYILDKNTVLICKTVVKNMSFVRHILTVGISFMSDKEIQTADICFMFDLFRLLEDMFLVFLIIFVFSLLSH